MVIVNWNGGEVLNECLESLSKIDYKNWELILVDNGSIDGSENIPSQFPTPISKFKLIKNSENLGFAKANNQGYKIAKGKYILLLNNDTKVAPDLLYELVKFMEENNTIGVIQPKIFIMDKPGYLDNAGSFLTKTGFLRHWGYMQKDSEEFNKSREIFSAKGACMFIRKDLIDKVGLFDDDFFNYFEESDFCWRVWIAGYSVMYVPTSYIYHKVGFSSKRQNQSLVYYHSLKNMLSAQIKNLEFKNLIQITPAFLFIVASLSIYYLLRFRLKEFMMIWKAIFWNLIHVGKILQKRSKIQRFRKVSDREIFDKVAERFSLLSMFSHFLKVEANFK